MKEVYDTIFSMDETETRDSLNDFLISSFNEILKTPEALYYPWKNLDKIGNLVSEDGKLRVFTWHLPVKNGSNYIYYGFIQYNAGKNKTGKENIFVFPLTDFSHKLKNPETLVLSPEKWYGAVYYNIKSFEFRREQYYVLMGFDFHDHFSQKKIIEVLQIDKDGNASFEGKFDMDFQQFKRIIFEYSDRVAMSVNYNERTDMIIWDHLSPFQPVFTGSYQFYGPDGSYDGISFEKSVFHLHKDVDARNQ